MCCGIKVYITNYIQKKFTRNFFPDKLLFYGRINDNHLKIKFT